MSPFIISFFTAQALKAAMDLDLWRFVVDCSREAGPAARRDPSRAPEAAAPAGCPRLLQDWGVPACAFVTTVEAARSRRVCRALRRASPSPFQPHTFNNARFQTCQ